MRDTFIKDLGNERFKGMTGVQHVKVSGAGTVYDLELKEKVTLIGGDSNSGRSLLCKLISEYEYAKQIKQASSVVVKADFECDAVDEIKGIYDIDKVTNHIVFITEKCVVYTHWEELIKRVNISDNYFVIITRDPIGDVLADRTYKLVKESCDEYGDYYRLADAGKVL